MACMDGGPSTEYLLKERLDNVTRMLCGICKKLYALPGRSAVLNLVDAETQIWYAQHVKEDVEREQAEKQRKQEKINELLRQQNVLNQEIAALQKG